MRNIDGNILFDLPPRVMSCASVVGKKEGEGPLRRYFDRIIPDAYAGKDTFEQAESEMTSTAVRIALQKGGYEPADMDLACCGDLLNQCVASSFAMRPFGIPYAGVYGACSTMALAMITAAVAVESGAARRAVCAASSHFCTAERQYRFPLEYGAQRPPTAQWTVTGAGACILEAAASAEPKPALFVNSAPADQKPVPVVDSAFANPKPTPFVNSAPADAKPATFVNSAPADQEPVPVVDSAFADAKPTPSVDSASADQEPVPVVDSAFADAKPATFVNSASADPDCRQNRTTASSTPPRIIAARLGRIIDYNITDQNNMGAAMAPAVVKQEHKTIRQ